MPLPAISGPSRGPLRISRRPDQCCSGRHSEAAYQSGQLVRQDVTEQVRGDDNVELPGIHDELHRGASTMRSSI